MDFLKGYRTLIVNVLTILAAGLGAVPPEWQESALVLMGIVNVALRFLTSTPVLSKL